MFEPKNLRRYKRPSSYIGPDWFECFEVAGQHRDSDCLERSNFRSILAKLGGESETVLVVRDSHWAVGWVETLRIVETDEAALRTADAILEKLQDYPIVDEEDFSGLEYEEACKTWSDFRVEDRIEWIKRHAERSVSIFAARRDELPEGDWMTLTQ